MEPHHERILKEASELREKLMKLDVFMDENELFRKLPIIDQDLMKEQREHMANYLEVLWARSERFEKP